MRKNAPIAAGLRWIADPARSAKEAAEEMRDAWRPFAHAFADVVRLLAEIIENGQRTGLLGNLFHARSAQLRAVRGTRSIYHNNSIQSWLVAANGEVRNVQVD